MEKKIFMIIDDDEDDRFFFKEAVVKKMINSPLYIEANDGEDALRKLLKVKQLPDFIFLDINMPCMDGRECLIQLKQDDKLKHIPVIMYSTSFSEKTINEFHKLGASNCMIKPTDLNKLPAQISEVIRGL
jgi:CheY-like chemotaxis protein